MPARAAAALIATPILFAAQAPAEEKTQERVWRHGASLLGDLKDPPDFKRFDYVNPNAPKGGTVRLSGFGGTYDNFNPVIAGVKGTIANGVAESYGTLMVAPLDEVQTSSG